MDIRGLFAAYGDLKIDFWMILNHTKTYPVEGLTNFAASEVKWSNSLLGIHHRTVSRLFQEKVSSDREVSQVCSFYG